MPKPVPPASTIDELIESPQLQIIVSGSDLRQQVFSTITLFAEAIRCVEFITMLKWHIGELCSRLQDRSMKDSLWLDILSVGVAKNPSKPANPNLALEKSSKIRSLLNALQRIDLCLSTARVLPTGIALRDSDGRRTHLAHSHLNSFYDAAALAQHVVLYICVFAFSRDDEIDFTAYLRQKETVFNYLLAKLDSADSEPCCTCIYALHSGVQKGLFTTMAPTIIVKVSEAIVKRLKKFLAESDRFEYITKEYDQINSSVEENFTLFSTCLSEVTGHEDVANLDLPVEYYFKDNEDLRKAYVLYSDSKKRQDVGKGKYDDYQRDLSFQFLSLRGLFLLITSATSIHFKFEEMLVRSSLENYRKIDYFESLKLEDFKLFQVLHDLPWSQLCDLYNLESELFGDSSILLLSAIIARFSDKLQEEFGCHLLPLVSRRLLQKDGLLSLLENRILSIFQYTVLRGCTQRIKRLYEGWNHSDDPKKPPNWLSQILLLGQKAAQLVVVEDHRAINKHIVYTDGTWSTKAFFPIYQVSNIMKSFFVRSSALVAGVEEVLIHNLCER